MKPLLKFLMLYTPFWMTIPALALILCGSIAVIFGSLFTLVFLSFNNPIIWGIGSLLCCALYYRLRKLYPDEDRSEDGSIYIALLVAGPAILLFLACLFATWKVLDIKYMILEQIKTA